ncbi:hypothetical protein M3Y97_00021100 [Aphelenchoides bicaudatus]|nr:hypothetical protein M3Y97_00021100 [Aphelenchoides bicaudatus]
MDAPEQPQTQTQIEIPDEVQSKRCGLGRLCSLHNQARAISVFLFLVCIAITAAFWDRRLALMSYQFLTLYVSLGCTAILLLGTFISIPILYLPAVYIMRLGMTIVCLLNTFLIVDSVNNVDTFIVDSVLSHKSSAAIYFNRNFSILSRCFKLSVQAWICFLIFGCLHLVAKDYHRLRAKTKQQFAFVNRWERNMMDKIRRISEPKPSTQAPIQDTFQLDGAVVKVTYPMVTVESNQPHLCEPISSNQQANSKIKQNGQPPMKITHENHLSAETSGDSDHPHQAFGFCRLYH